MPTRFTVFAAAVVLTLTTIARSAEPAIPDIGPVGKVQELHTDLKFTEGPADDGKGNLYFSDVGASRVYVSTKDGKLETFLEGAGRYNGLMFDADGTLYACVMDGRIVSINVKTKQITPLVEQYNKVRFNAPNDLVLDKQGGIYFTDPHFLAPEPLPQKVPAVYYRAADGEVTRIATVAKACNGVILSLDEKTLYVIPSLQSEMLAYPVLGPGKLGDDRVFCTLKQPEGEKNTGGDGLTIDTNGNLYIASQLGVQVWSPAGEYLGLIEFPQQPANVTFGGPDRKTLYATCRTGVYSVKMQAQGHKFTGKQ